jgi:hypothetical protein
MRAPVNALRPFLVKATAEAREKLAAELYHSDRVKGLATTAALAGASSLRLTQEAAIDLQRTEAARALEAWASGQRLHLAWEPRNLRADDGRDIRVHEPVVSWSDAESL